MADLNGKDFRARVELTNKANQIVAAVGMTCERVDPKSLGWLFEQKLIEPTEAAWADLGRAVDAAPTISGLAPGEPATSSSGPIEQAGYVEGND